MITTEEAIKLLRRYGVEEDRITHSIAVADFAADLCTRILSKNPDVPADAQNVRIAALLHDIGRCRRGDHEVESVKILLEEKMPELAALVMHGSLYEIMQLRGVEDPSLLPQSLENKIVAYADARVRFAPVSLQERIDEIRKRRYRDDEKVRAIELAAPRFERLEKELMEMTT